MKKKTILAAIGIFLLMSGTAAATYFVTVSTVKDKNPPAANTDKKTSPATSDETKNDQAADDNVIVLTLYFSDTQAQYLTAETRSIEKTGNPAKSAVEELAKGPKQKGLAVTVPSTMVVQDVIIDNGVATVDFGPAFGDLIPRGETGEKMFIYSIVDTLTGIDGISGVKFAAGGKAPSVGNSRTDFSAVFNRDENLIRK